MDMHGRDAPVSGGCCSTRWVAAIGLPYARFVGYLFQQLSASSHMLLMQDDEVLGCERFHAVQPHAVPLAGVRDGGQAEVRVADAVGGGPAELPFNKRGLVQLHARNGDVQQPDQKVDTNLSPIYYFGQLGHSGFTTPHLSRRAAPLPLGSLQLLQQALQPRLLSSETAPEMLRQIALAQSPHELHAYCLGRRDGRIFFHMALGGNVFEEVAKTLLRMRVQLDCVAWV